MPLGIPRAGGSGLVPLCGLSIVHHGSQGRDSRENKLLGQERAGKASTGAGFKERGARVPLGCPGGPPGPSCPLGLALTRIAGTRVMVGVGASLVTAPDGGPGFLAAGTGLVRREGRRVSLGLRSPAGGLYRQALPRTPRPSPETLPGHWWEGGSVWGTSAPKGDFVAEFRAVPWTRGPSWGRKTSNLVDKYQGLGITQTWVQISAPPFCPT